MVIQSYFVVGLECLSGFLYDETVMVLFIGYNKNSILIVLCDVPNINYDFYGNFQLEIEVYFQLYFFFLKLNFKIRYALIGLHIR